MPILDFCVAQMLLLPGESYVKFQLAAQKMRPNSFVWVAGYGEGGDWCWVHPSAGKLIIRAMGEVLQKPPF